MKTFLTTFCLASALATAALSASDTVQIEHPIIFETLPSAKSAAGYMTVKNTGTVEDRLISAKADFAHAEVHETTVNAEGVARMQHAEHGFVLPVGEDVVFKPGGKHIMLMRLSEQMVAGEDRPITLVFENAGQIEVLFKVETRAEHAEHSAAE